MILFPFARYFVGCSFEPIHRNLFLASEKTTKIWRIIQCNTNLLTTGKLDQHLAEIDNACEERMELLTRQMASQEGMTEVVKAGDALTDSLTEEQKELFEDYMTAQREVNVLTDCETFIYAFRLAAKIMTDVLIDGQMREI